MKVTERPALENYNSFGVAASAALLYTVESEEDLLSLPGYDPQRDFVLGGGSNVLFATDVPGAVFLNRIDGREIIEQDQEQVLIEVGAGENWHDLVLWSLEKGYSGLENLSLIPGLAGAAPMQNIGAYGVELSSILESVTAWDWQRASWETFSRDECKFRYRDSLFKSEQPDRFLITSIRLRLDRKFHPRLDYPGLHEELQDRGIAEPTARDVSEAVIRIRTNKLPDPGQTGNAGSFFRNPLLRTDAARTLLESFPGMPAWSVDEHTTKVSAAWMIEHCGLKGCREGDAGVSDQHALVLVNLGRATGREVLQLADRVTAAVDKEFGIMLEPEPRIVTFQ